MADRLSSPTGPVTKPTTPLSESFRSVGDFFKWLTDNWLVLALVILVFILGYLVLIFIRKRNEEVDEHADYFDRIERQCRRNMETGLDKVFIYNENGIRALGEYTGHCYTVDGYFNIRYRIPKFDSFVWNLILKIPFINKFLYNQQIVRMNDNKVWTEAKTNTRGIAELDRDGKPKDVIKHELTNKTWVKDPKNITLHILDVQTQGYFQYPVMRNEDGNIVDKSYENYERQSSPIRFEHMQKQSKRFTTEVNRNSEINKDLATKQNLDSTNIKSPSESQGNQ